MSEQLRVQSEKFHAFEWLRSEALKGNKHAAVMTFEVALLNDNLKVLADAKLLLQRLNHHIIKCARQERNIEHYGEDWLPLKRELANLLARL